MRLYLLDKDGLDGYLSTKEYVKDLKLLTLLSRDLLLSNAKDVINKITKNYKDKGLTNSNMVFAFNNDFNKAVFTNKELDNLKLLTDYFAKKHIKLGVYNEKFVYNHEQIKNACLIIKDNVNRINSRKYSPLEKLMHAYFVVANRNYVAENEAKESPSISRSVYGVLNSDKIVCKGFANYLQAIVTEINDENLKCFANDFGMIKKRKKQTHISGHSTNIIYINDNKYGINGFFHIDPTFDHYRDSDESYGLAYFLINMADIGKIYDKEKVKDIDLTEYLYYKLNGDNGEVIDNTWDNYCINSVWPRTCSLSSDGTNIVVKSDYDDMHQQSLGDYLLSRQDFKDFLILVQTEKDNKRNKYSFDKNFDKNYKIAQNNILDLDIIKNKKIINRYMLEHSSNIDMKTIIDGLSVVIKNYDNGKTKDDKSKSMYKIIKKAIEDAKYFMDKSATSEFSKSEYIK